VTRAYSRRSLDIDLSVSADDDEALRLVRTILAPDERGSLAALETLVAGTEQHRSAVGRSLQSGVEQALTSLVSGFRGRRRQPIAIDAALADSLTVVYRVLFLLFAEARGLVPQWHPIYRESYTIESLRPAVEDGRSPAGLWQSLQAIARLAHHGCAAGTLTVVPFNGRLFAPSKAPLAESIALDDRLVRDVLLAVTTSADGDRRARISYADLGVEQLGAVYERVLDYRPPATAPSPATTGYRKATGTFYTPRSITEYLVRRALAPLVRGRTPAALLDLRVVDPAMGSGAFLVAACRYLADAYEEALVANGDATRGEISPGDRAGFRRVVAIRCLYGVDINPTAVQLARLSLWLCTLAADRPLSFLDHHLRTGNSLAGARLADLARQPPVRGRRRTMTPLPLVDDDELVSQLASTVGPRIDVARETDDTVAAVRRKERVIDALHGDRGPLAGWRASADAWCAVWFWPDDLPSIGSREWPALNAALGGRDSGLPDRLIQQWRATVAAVTARERFFHWEIEFPEIFFDASGAPRADAGFDAVIGNPPWTAAQALTAFSRESGCYRLQSDGHANLYQLFAERMLALTKAGGRVGALMPAGLLGDHGCARLRAHLFERCAVDALLGFENSAGLFPIHRGMRFALVTATTGGSTDVIPSRSGLRTASELDDVPDEGPVPDQVSLPLDFVRRFSGPGLEVPLLAAERDREILSRVLGAVPALGSDRGWDVQFRRELNATDDRDALGARGWPVLEGKLLDPFVAHVDRAARFIEPSVARRMLGSRVDRPRLGYREVAASTNRLTLIAAVIPAQAVTTHTIFCLRDAMTEDDQWCLCGLLNSFVANYLVRLRGGTHVPASVMRRLPVPWPDTETRARLASLARRASADPADAGARADVNACAAQAYGIGPDDLVHILSTFPLVPEPDRTAVLNAI
jgi:hypothetical protein